METSFLKFFRKLKLCKIFQVRSTVTVGLRVSIAIATIASASMDLASPAMEAAARDTSRRAEEAEISINF
jgi:hypothetical protein